MAFKNTVAKQKWVIAVHSQLVEICHTITTLTSGFSSGLWSCWPTVREKTVRALKQHRGSNNTPEAETKLHTSKAKQANGSKQTSKRRCRPTCKSLCTFTPSEASFRAQTSWIGMHGRLFAVVFCTAAPCRRGGATTTGAEFWRGHNCWNF